MEYQLFLQLGNFARLPPEIRLKIWEHLFASLWFRTQLPESDCRRASKNLSILCANKYLYEEISCHLYPSVAFTIHITPSYDKQRWMIAEACSRPFGVSVQCDLRDMADVKRYLQNLPCRTNPLNVCIYAPARRDPGQAVLLWQKANALVDLLIALRHDSGWLERPRLAIHLDGSCHSKGEPKKSLKNRRYYYLDVDLAVLPFCRLKPTWHVSLDIPRQMSDAMDKESTLPRRSMLSRVREVAPIKQRRLYFEEESLRSLDLDQWLVNAAVFVEKALDDLPGNTARMLRRDRLSSWYEDGDSWKSQYEEQLLSKFPTHLETVQKHDYRLSAAFCRFRLAILLHHIAHAKKDDRENAIHALKTDQPRPYTTWDSKTWEAEFPDGVPELKVVGSNLPEWIRPHEWRVLDAYRKGIPRCSSFSQALYWWGFHARDVLKGVTSKYYKCGLCRSQKSACRWCKEYDPDLLCGLCRDFNVTGMWPKFECPRCRGEDFDKPCGYCIRWDCHEECERCRGTYSLTEGYYSTSPE